MLLRSLQPAIVGMVSTVEFERKNPDVPLFHVLRTTRRFDLDVGIFPTFGEFRVSVKV